MVVDGRGFFYERKTMKRTLINETTKKVGETVMLQGWVDTKRDHGKLTFIDLRDRSGKVQCVGFQKMGELTTESVIEIEGLVKARPEKMINKDLPTGTVEVDVQSYTILNKSVELPMTLDSDGREVSEEVRLKYRYLDLRRERMQKNIRLRSAFTQAISDAFYKREFVNIETPMLTKSTKEGARDFIVPSRFQPGKFYALPQSPQQYKQLLMTAGFERYFQIARCFRDEDLRADRGFELTQVDVEMSFVERQDVMDTMEAVVKEAVKAVGGKLKAEEFPVVTYQEAMEKYGADRFDLRTDEEKKDGTLAFAWVVDFPFFKKVDTKDAAEVRDGKSGWTFTHNPFSSPMPEHLEWHLKQEKIDQIITAQYDLVCNGYEVGGGSIRAHDPEVLKTTFKIMGYTDEEIEASVGHMLEAFKVGTPPHGGIALGLDRLIMVLSGEESMKESVAFPMTSTGRTSVMDAPSEVSSEQLAEVGLRVAA
jgi:aspartyl-tRNA synthetase